MYYFAWVNRADSVWSDSFARDDEDMFSFQVVHNEGEYPTATVLIRTPQSGLLASGRKTYVWISQDNASGTGYDALFFGRIAGLPTALGDSVVQLVVRARPYDAQQQKEALAATMKVRPYWDPVWIKPDRRDDPDTVLESRPVLWHFDRTSPVVTASDIITGEDGTLTLTQDDIFEASLSIALGEPPLRNVKVEGEVYWSQTATGTIDVTSKVTQAFRAAGSDYAGYCSSFTGQGLFEDWPENETSIGAGWEVGEVSLIRSDGLHVPAEYVKTNCRNLRVPTEGDSTNNNDEPVTIAFRLWQIRPQMSARYDVERQRTERVEFTLAGDVQPLYVDVEDEETETITFSSNEIAVSVDPDGTDVIPPIVDVRRSQYFTTERGNQSIEFLIAVARARLLARSRAVRVTVAVPFDTARLLSCRMNATIVADGIPGGTATGKVVSYGFSVSEQGDVIGTITIACSVGKGNTVTATTGSPVYAEGDYVETQYQQYEGGTSVPISGSLWYVPPSDPPVDDGVDFMDMTTENNVLSCTVTNGETAQRVILSRTYDSAADAVNALNEAYTEVSLVMRPLTGGPFEQVYYLQVSDLMVPKTIDLEAGA